MLCLQFFCVAENFFGIALILLQLQFSNGKLSKSSLVSNYNANDASYFKEFHKLLAEYKPLSFGPGFADFNPPKNLQNALAKAATSDDYKLSQYSPDDGNPRLLKALANLYSKLTNRTLNPSENVVVTIGATEALYAIVQAQTIPGDEWILFAPYYHRYHPLIVAAHGVPRYIPLILNKTTGNITSADFKFNKKDLANLFNEKTKGIIVNTPHNPTGKIFDYEELSYIAELARKWDVLIIFDEVYQFLNYDHKEHFRLATFPGMFERTISVGSAGKMFAATGYRVGWAYGPKQLIDNIKAVSPIIVHSVPSPIQEAVAEIMEEETKNYGKSDSYIEQFKRESEEGRDYIYTILKDVGMTPIIPEGGYFILIDWTTMVDKDELDQRINEYADYSFVRWLVKNVGIFGNPLSRAYGDDGTYKSENFVRFNMIKKKETLLKLKELLLEWKERTQMIKTECSENNDF